MKLKTKYGALALSVLCVGCHPPAASADEPATQQSSEARVDLEKHRWKDRLILLFAPSEEDETLQTMRETLDASEDELQERDVVVYTFVGNSQTHRRFEVGEDETRYILLGLDGHEKMRAEALDLDEVLQTIDAMPMRQREIRRQERSKDE